MLKFISSRYCRDLVIDSFFFARFDLIEFLFYLSRFMSLNRIAAVEIVVKSIFKQQQQLMKDGKSDSNKRAAKASSMQCGAYYSLDVVKDIISVRPSYCNGLINYNPHLMCRDTCPKIYFHLLSISCWESSHTRTSNYYHVSHLCLSRICIQIFEYNFHHASKELRVIAVFFKVRNIKLFNY
jgi:hypothetical protein